MSNLLETSPNLFNFSDNLGKSVAAYLMKGRSENNFNLESSGIPSLYLPHKSPPARGDQTVVPYLYSSNNLA